MKLRAAREASGKTQKQVAKEVGMTERGYQKLEAQENYKTVQRAILLADALGTDVKTLFGAAPPTDQG